MSAGRRITSLGRLALAVALAVAMDGVAIVPGPSATALATTSAPTAEAAVTPAAATATTYPASSTYQETSSSISYSGSWASASYSGYLGGRAKYSRQKGAAAGFRFTGVGVSWISSVGPTRGYARVYVNGIYVKTVNLYSRTFVARKTVFSITYAAQAPRTLRIVVAGTPGHPMVAVDALVVTQLVATSGLYPADTSLRYLATSSISRPGYRSSIIEPALGTVTTRVSNGSGVRHAYSRISAWNADGSKILLGFGYPGRMLDGRTFADLGSFRQVSQAIWSNVDPNRLYGAIGNAVYRQNATTAALTKLRTFTAYRSITIGDYEGGISDDDRFMALIGTTSTGVRHLITYNVAANTVVGDVSVPSTINNAQISRKGTYVVVTNNRDGTARGQGVERYTQNLASRITLVRYGRHGDNALDASGNEIFVSNNAPYVTAFNLATGQATRLLSMTTAFEYGHVSGRNIHRPGWIYLSVFDNRVTAGRPGRDQVVAVKTDGSGTVEVFGFSHHSTSTVYATQPQAVPSRDGKQVLFASDWGGGVYAYIAQRR